jgi:hypothetical protein
MRRCRRVDIMFTCAVFAQGRNSNAHAFTEIEIRPRFHHCPNLSCRAGRALPQLRGGLKKRFRDGLMNASIISALAALLGAAIGGLTSVLASWLTQQTQAKAQWIAQERARRQELYKDFIEEAAKCYVDALQHDKPDISALVGIYAKIDRMRVQSSSKVVESAERVGRQIVDTYLAPDKSFLELREMLNSGEINLLREFGDACRAEFDSLRAQQF